MHTGPILLIDDDEDDQLFIRQALRELNVTNPIRCFRNGQEGLDYLLAGEQQPFLILCDINMPMMNGLELHQRIEQNPTLRQKSIPFVFLTTADSMFTINLAYATTIQGFFRKTTSYGAMKEQLGQIVGYWQHCLHPNNV